MKNEIILYIILIIVKLLLQKPKISYDNNKQTALIL